MKKVLSALLLTAVFAVPALAHMDMEMKDHGECQCQDQKMEMPHTDRMGHMMEMCIMHADKLGLTDEQVAKMKAIRRSMRVKHIQLDADKEIAQIELMAIMEIKDFDLDKANAAVKKIGESENSEHLEMLKTMKECRSVLTNDQFTKMKKLMEEYHSGRME